MKQAKIILMVLAVILSLLVFPSCKANAIDIIVKDNDTDITSGIEKMINRGNQHNISITVKDSLVLDDLKIVTYITSDKYFGYSVLEQKGSGSYRVGGTGAGTNRLDCPVVKTNKGEYMLFIGNKLDTKIEYAKIKLDEQMYIFELDGNPNPILAYAVPNDTNEAMHGSIVTFPDESNKDISNEVSIN